MLLISMMALQFMLLKTVASVGGCKAVTSKRYDGVGTSRSQKP